MSAPQSSPAALGFWRSFFGACAGTAVFDTLTRHTLARTFWHLLLMGFFCSLGVTLAQGGRLERAAAVPIEAFLSEFGSIVVGSDTVKPAKEPERGREIKLPSGVRIIYTPEFSAKSRLPRIADGETALLWSPRLAALIQNGGGVYSAVLPLSPDAFTFLNTGDERKFVARLASVEGKHTASLAAKMRPEVLLSPESVGGVLKILFFLLFGLTALFLALILSATFSLVYRLAGARARGLIGYGEVFRVAVYAGFPAMAVGALFPAFDLPYFSFETVFSIGLSLYMLFVLSHLEISRRAKLAPQTPKQEDQ